MTRFCAVLAMSLALVAMACGEEPTEAAKVADAYNELVEAVDDRDYATACDRLSDGTREDLRKAGEIQQTSGCDKTLERVIEDVGTNKDALAPVTPSDVRIDGPARATVNEVRMSKSGDGWHVEGDIDFVRPFLSGPPLSR